MKIRIFGGNRHGLGRSHTDRIGDSIGPFRIALCIAVAAFYFSGRLVRVNQTQLIGAGGSQLACLVLGHLLRSQLHDKCGNTVHFILLRFLHQRTVGF